jgi:drug/metabolite transporter (DMT)-like permease
VGSFIPAFLFATAQTRIDSAISGVLNALTPIFTILAGASLFRSRFTTRVILGIVIGFIGSVVLITAGSKGVFWQVNFYALLIVLGTAFYGLNVNVIKFYLGDLKSSHITSLSMLMMGPLALIYLFTQADLFSPLNESGGALLSFLAIVTLGVMGSAVALILFNILLKITNPVFSSSVTYLMPVVAIMWGLLDGEILNEKHILGILFTLTGVFIANTNKNS